MVTRFKIESQVLDWAISNTDLSDEQVSEKIEKFKLVKWKTGEIEPTINQIQLFAKEFHIPFGYLFLKTPPIENNVPLAFRTIENRPAKISRGFQEVIQRMQTRQEWMKDEVVDSGGTSLEIVGKFVSERDASQIADFIRGTLNFSDISRKRNIDEFYKVLKSAISKQNIMVMQDGTVNGNTHRNLSTDEVRAFVLIDNYAPLIFLNTRDAKTAKIFSLLHEFVHILRGSDEVLSTERQTTEERFINKVVEKVLMPEVEFKKRFDLSTIDESARYFHVSIYAAAIRAKNLNMISQDELQDIMKINHFIPQIDDKKDKTKGNYYNTAISKMDPVFMKKVIGSYNSRKTSTTEAADLMGVSLKSFKKFVEKFQERYN